MPLQGYRTINNRSQGFFRDRGSKFLAFAIHVTTEEQVKDILDELRREYYDARHHCFAWRIQTETELFRTNDDGEPSGTAGRPILGQIQKHHLTNILIVVVRYFGGTLLGTGGLVKAYRSAAADAIANAGILIKTVKELLEVRFPYLSMNDVMTVIKEEQAEQIEQDFGMDCTITVSIPLERAERMTGRLKGIGQVIVNKLSINY